MTGQSNSKCKTESILHLWGQWGLTDFSTMADAVVEMKIAQKTFPDIFVISVNLSCIILRLSSHWTYT